MKKTYPWNLSGRAHWRELRIAFRKPRVTPLAELYAWLEASGQGSSPLEVLCDNDWRAVARMGNGTVYRVQCSPFGGNYAYRLSVAVRPMKENQLAHDLPAQRARWKGNQ